MSAIITIQGYAGQDVKHKETGSGTPVSEVSIAVSVYNGANAERTTNWYRVTMFGNFAKAIADVRKGDYLTVTGEFKVREYEKDGVKNQSLEVIGQYVQNVSKFLKPRQESSGGSAPPPRRESASSASAPDDLPF